MKLLATDLDIIKIISTKACNDYDYLFLNQNISHILSKKLTLMDWKASYINSCSIFPKIKEEKISDKPINYKIKKSEINNYYSHKRKKLASGSYGNVFTLNDPDGKIISIEKESKEEDYEPYYECAIGLLVNDLKKYVPNFVYTYGCYTYKDNPCLAQEYIDGKVLNKVIENLDPQKIYSIYVQLANALNVAYEKLRYNHNDLHSQNIIIKELDYYVDIPIYFQNGTIKYHRTNVIAYIFDYGFSRLEYENKIYIPRESNFDVNFDTYDSFNPEIYNHDIDLYKLLVPDCLDFNDGNLQNFKIGHDVFEVLRKIFKLIFGFYDPELLHETDELDNFYDNVFKPAYYEHEKKFSSNYDMIKKLVENNQDIFKKKYFNFDEYINPPFTNKKMINFKREMKKIASFYPGKYINNLYKGKTAYYDFLNYFSFEDKPLIGKTICNEDCVDYRTFLINTLKDQRLKEKLLTININNYENLASKLNIDIDKNVRNKFDSFIDQFIGKYQKDPNFY